MKSLEGKLKENCKEVCCFWSKLLKSLLGSLTDTQNVTEVECGQTREIREKKNFKGKFVIFTVQYPFDLLTFLELY